MMHHVKRLAKKKSVIGMLSLAIVGGTYAGFEQTQALEPTQYVLAAVAKGTVVVSVKGSGQVSGKNQVEIKPLVSGAVSRLLVKPGEKVAAGTPLIEIDRKVAVKAVRDASQAVTDARISLESAKLSHSKLTQPTDAVALMQAQNSLAQAKRDLDKLKQPPDAFDIAQAQAELDLQMQNIQLSDDGKNPNGIRNAYDNAVPVVKSIAQTLQQSLYDADAVLGIDNVNANDAYEKLLSVLDSSKLLHANALYASTKIAVTSFKSEADALAASGEDSTRIDAVLSDAQYALALMDPLLQNVYDALLHTLTSYSFNQSSLTSLQNTIQSDRTSVSSKLTSLVSQTQALAQAKTSFATAELNVQKSKLALEKLKRGADASAISTAEERVRELEQALAKLQRGTDPIDISISENGLAQRQSSLQSAVNRLTDAQEALNDYTVIAPFDGVIAKITAREGDQASEGTALLTLMTEQKVAVISLNEVDASKIKNGQKVTMTFDAVPDLTIAGTVSDVDALGTVSQGVVNYTITIAFDTQDERIKPGMSVATAIITAVNADVLVVPNGAIRQENGTSVLQTLSGVTEVGQPVTPKSDPTSIVVQTGLANDQQTEILRGVSEGDLIIVRTIVPIKAKASATAPSAVGIPGLGGGGTFTRPIGGVGR